MINNLPGIIREYLSYMLTVKGRSKKTIDAYAYDLKMFTIFLVEFRKNNNKPLNDKINMNLDISNISTDFFSDITRTDAYEFIYYTSQYCANQARARARKISAIRSFFKYLTTTKFLFKENPMTNLDIPKINKSLPRYLSLEDASSLLDKGVDEGDEDKFRNKCILTLFLNCGIRISELVGINLYDINDNKLRILGKGNKERILYLNDSCIFAIKSYINEERAKLKIIKDNDALFLGIKTGKRLSARQVQNIVKKSLQKAGLDSVNITPHKLRHTAATLMYQHGNVDIRVLKEILGHENIGTTEIYTHISDKNIKDALNKNPLNKK